RGLTDGRRRCSLFAFFEVPKVVPNGHADALQRLFADARNLFELFGRHVGQRLHGGDAASHQFLDNGLAQLGDLLYGRGRAAGQSLHLLLDFLPLFFFALDVDLPAQQLGGKTHVLAFFADGQRKLRVIDDHFKLLFAQVGDGNAADFGWLQRLFGEGCNLVTEFDNVNFFAAQLANDGLYAHAFHADAGAYRVHILVAALHGDLGALAGLAGDGADHDRAVVDFRNLGLKQVLYQLRRGAGDNHLRTLGRAVHFKQHHAHALAHGKLLKARLLTLGAAGFRLADIEYRVLAFDALDGGVQDLLFAMGVFLEDGVALRFANLLENHLLGQLRGNAAQRAGVAIEANLASRLDAGSQLVGFRESDLVDRVLDLVLVGYHSLVYVGRDFAGVLVKLPAHVFLGLVILAGSQGNCFLN